MAYLSKLITAVFEKHIPLCFNFPHRRKPSNLRCKHLSLGRGGEAAEGNCCGKLETPLARRKGDSAGAILLSPNSSLTSSCKHLNEKAESPQKSPVLPLFLIQPALSQVVFAASHRKGDVLRDIKEEFLLCCF